MRVTEQILAVIDYGTEEEDVMGCFDGLEEARRLAPDLLDFGPVTLCRVKIIEVEGTIGQCPPSAWTA